MSITVETRGLKRELPAKRPIHRAIFAVLQAEDVSLRCEGSVVLTNDATIEELHRQYLHRQGPTDVIAFHHQFKGQHWPRYSEKPNPENPPVVLGDVVVSVDAARRQAAEYGLTLEQELCLLTIHGLLHLLGYEDTTASRRRRMCARQWEILVGLYPELARQGDRHSDSV